MGLPLQQQVNQSMELNASLPLHGASGMVGQRAYNSKNAAKQFMNASFDASKSANTINYVNSAYMSAIPSGHGPAGNSSGIPSGAKLSKVGLK